MYSTFQALGGDIFPWLGPNIALGLHATDGGDVKEDSVGPTPGMAPLAPLDPEHLVELVQGHGLRPSSPLVSKPLPLPLGCPRQDFEPKSLVGQHRELCSSCTPIFSDEGVKLSSALLAQQPGATRVGEVGYLACGSFLLQDAAHSMLRALECSGNGSIGQPLNFFEEDDLPACTL
jgi:hypothetical protein